MKLMGIDKQIIRSVINSRIKTLNINLEKFLLYRKFYSVWHVLCKCDFLAFFPKAPNCSQSPLSTENQTEALNSPVNAILKGQIDA